MTLRPALLVLLAAAGCADPVSCDALDVRQPDDALRTCLASARLDDETTHLTLPDGSALALDALPSPAADTFPDGVRLVAASGHLAWIRDGRTVREDAVGPTAGAAVVAASGDRYAVPLAEGVVRVRSRDGSDPVDLPVEVEWVEIGGWRGPSSVPVALSADARRVAAAGRALTVADARTGEPVWQAALDTTARGVALSPDGARVAVALADRTVAAWDLASSADLGRRVHPRPGRAVAFRDDGGLAVWLLDRTSTRTVTRTAAPAGSTTRETTETPPAVVLWRLP